MSAAAPAPGVVTEAISRVLPHVEEAEARGYDDLDSYAPDALRASDLRTLISEVSRLREGIRQHRRVCLWPNATPGN